MKDWQQPLAYRLAPQTIADYIGQEHILAPGKLLRRLIEADKLSSIILFGPPGTGKTSLARVIANTTTSRFCQLNAVTAGIKDIKNVISENESAILSPQRRTVLFIDEIHRFNKAQQDALLPYVENGSLILIGATTENPYFEVNKALLSRSTVFQLKPLSEEALEQILQRALSDVEVGYGRLPVKLDEDAQKFWLQLAQGDARVMLNALELAVLTTAPNDLGEIHISYAVAQECLQKSSIYFDKNGESHYDTISALIKSIRGSDPNAAIHYLARALKGGEAEFIARRLVIVAAEDIGLANPQLLPLALAGYQAVERIGMPEARIVLAEVVVALASSPKSNSAYLAIDEALADLEKMNVGEIPLALRNAPVKEMKDLGYSTGYHYAHNYKYHFYPMDFLPQELKDKKYYVPTELGYEQKITQWLDFLEKVKAEYLEKKGE